MLFSKCVPKCQGQMCCFQSLVVLGPLSISANVTLDERHYFPKLALLAIFKTISFRCLFLTSLYFSNSILVSILLSTVFFLSFTLQDFFPLAFYVLTSVVYFSTFTVIRVSYLWFLSFPHSICLSCSK